MRRGQYTLNVRPDALASMTADLKVPLELREAREAGLPSRRLREPDKYAADTMQKVAVAMTNAEGYYRSHK